MKKIIMRAGALGVAVFPFAASAAQGTANLDYFSKSATKLTTLIGDVFFPLVFAGAVLGFLVGVGMYLFSAGNDKMKTKAQDVMKWGLIILVVMFSVYGIITLIGSVLGIDGRTNDLTLPRVPTVQ